MGKQPNVCPGILRSNSDAGQLAFKYAANITLIERQAVQKALEFSPCCTVSNAYKTVLQIRRDN